MVLDGFEHHAQPAELVTQLRKGERAAAGDLIESFLASQTVLSRYRPDDEEVTNELQVLPAHQRVRRRHEMLGEAVEIIRARAARSPPVPPLDRVTTAED